VWDHRPTADELLDDRLARGWAATPTGTVDGPVVLGHAACRMPAGRPAGESAGKPAGKPAGESAGKPAGESAGKPAGESAGKSDQRVLR
jgi:hypothetical protein